MSSFSRAAAAFESFGDAVGAGIADLAERAGIEMRILPKDGERLLRQKLIESGLYAKLKRRKREQEHLSAVKRAGRVLGASEKVEEEIWERCGRKFSLEPEDTSVVGGADSSAPGHSRH